jgi:hypothetical protein
LHEAAFGEESNEKSGIALARKQNQAQIVTYNFPDNMAKGIKRTWELMLDLIPHIYDAERELRILGADGAEDYVKINEVVPGPSDASGMPTMVRVNDMSAGKYDVTITVGPNFSTLRQEAAEIYGELGAKNPALMQVAGDLVFKSMDLPYADEIAKRWQTILPPPIQKQITEGKDIPPEAQAAMAQAEQAMQAVQAQGQMVQAAAQEVEQEKAKATADKAGVEKAIANLRTEEAKFQTLVANAKTEIQKALNEIAIREAKLDVRELGLSHENDKLAQEKDKAAGTLNGAAIVEATLHNLDALTSNFMANSQAMMVAEANMKKKAKPKSIKGRREKGGQLVAEIEYGEGDTTGLPVSIVSSRDANGALIGVPQYANPNLTG